MRVADAMMPYAAFCLPETPAPEIAALMEQEDCDSIPVVDDDLSRKVIGVVTGRDLIRRIVAKGMDSSLACARDCMSHDVAAIEPAISLENAYDVMRGRRVDRLFVLDEIGCLRGILSWANIDRLSGAVEGPPANAPGFNSWRDDFPDFAEVRRHPASGDHISDPTKPALGMSPCA